MLELTVFAVAMATLAPQGSHEVLRAYQKQSGLEATVQRIEREQVPQPLRVPLGHAAFITKSLLDQRVTLKWSFP